MAFRTQVCVVAVCDLCGNSRDQDWNERHHDTEVEALSFVLSDPDDLPDAMVVVFPDDEDDAPNPPYDLPVGVGSWREL